MLASFWSCLGFKKVEPSPSPSPVTITGVRIPADGTPAHLLSLTTVSDSSSWDSFLFHVPDLRHYWKTELAWDCRDLHRLDFLQHRHVPYQHHLQQKHHLQQLLHSHRHPQHPTRQQLLHLRQRYRPKQQYHVLRQHHSTCMGTYYFFYSFAADDLPKHSSVPTWFPPSIVDDGHGLPYGLPQQYWGDVFLVKMAPHEYGEHGWAAYEDIVPEFLELLIEGPEGPLDG